MGQTLENSIYLPDEGETNCYSGLASNWRALDTLKGSYSLHAINVDIHVTAAEKETWNSKADNSALTAHTGDTTIHVTAEDKNKWNAVTSKADDSAVVHKSMNETVSGTKTFDSNTLIYNSDTNATTPNLYLRSSKIEISSQGNTSGDQNLTYLDKNNTTYAYVKGAIQSNGSAVKIRAIAKDSSDNSVINELQILAYTNGNKAIFPTYSKEIDLGISSYKWKSFNGLEPSSLGMPSYSGTIDISGYITDLTGVNLNNYTPSANGYIVITCNSNDVDYIKMSNNLDFVSVVDNTNNQFTSGILGVWQPCIAGIGIQIRIKSSALRTARFIPCQGNI